MLCHHLYRRQLISRGRVLRGVLYGAAEYLDCLIWFFQMHQAVAIGLKCTGLSFKEANRSPESGTPPRRNPSVDRPAPPALHASWHRAAAATARAGAVTPHLCPLSRIQSVPLLPRREDSSVQSQARDEKLPALLSSLPCLSTQCP